PLLRALRPVAPAVLEEEAPAARDLLDREARAGPRRDQVEQRARLRRHLDADPVAGQERDRVAILHPRVSWYSRSSSARDDATSRGAMAWPSSPARWWPGTAMPRGAASPTPSPLRKSTAGTRPRSTADSIEERIRR